MRSAWDKVAGELLEIRHGEAKLLKARCDAGELECPLEGCPAPTLKTQTFYRRMNGTLVEDVFAHVSLGENFHTPESIRHQDSKAAIAGWQKRIGSVNVRVERTIRTRTHEGRVPVAKRRKPDVLSMLRNGVAMSFEIQTSTISGPNIQDRTRDQQSAGCRVVWLFSWLWVSARSAHLDAHSTGLRELIECGDDIWFLDPYAEGGPALGRARAVIARGGTIYRVRPRRDSSQLEVLWRPIDDYRVDTTGRIVTVDNISDWPDEEEFEAIERAEAMEAARAAAEAEARQKEAVAAEARRLLETRRRQQLAEAEAAATRRRRTHNAPIVTDLGPEIEELCAKENAQDCHVFAPSSEWKRPTARWLIVSIAPQTFASIQDYVMAFCDGDLHAHSAIGAFIRDLRDAGVIRSTGNGYAPVASARGAGSPRLF